MTSRMDIRKAILLAAITVLALSGTAAAAVNLPGDAARALVGLTNTTGVGSSVAPAGDFNADGRPDWIAGGFAASRRAYVLFGGDGPRTVVAGERALESGTGFTIRGGGGYTVSPAGDFNGDGAHDVAVEGSTKTATAIVDNVTIVLGRKGITGGGVDLDAGESPQAIKLNGIDPSSIASAGDMNGDGLGDLVIGNPHQTWGGKESAGVAVIVYGRKSTAAINVLSPGSGTTILAGKNGAPEGSPDADGDMLGSAVSGAGDVDGDGLADIVVGARGVGGTAANYRPGAAFVVYGSRRPANQVIDPAAFDPAYGFAINAPPGSVGSLGASVAGLADVTGDGRPDIAVGAPFLDQNRGRVWVVRGGRMPGAVSVTDPAAVAMSIQTPPAESGAGYEFFGKVIAAAGDVNGDGRGDLAVSGFSGTKRVHVFYGGDNAAPRFSGGDLEAASGFTIVSPDRTKADRFGDSVAGYSGNVLVGARTSSGSPGAAYVVADPSRPKPAGVPLLEIDKVALKSSRLRASSRGTALLIDLSAPAKVKIAIYRYTGKARCQRPVSPIVPRSCNPELVRVGSFGIGKRTASPQRVAFTGRVGGKPLQRGRYIAHIQAQAGNRLSPARSVPFEILGS